MQKSRDGIKLGSPEGVVAIDYKSKFESRVGYGASVLKEGDLYRMWYSYRGGNRLSDESEKTSYRIGYAESRDGNFPGFEMDDAAGG